MAHDIFAPWGYLEMEPPAPLTAEDLMRLGDAARGCELVEGRLLRMPPTGLEHSDIAGNIYVACVATSQHTRSAAATTSNTAHPHIHSTSRTDPSPH